MSKFLTLAERSSDVRKRRLKQLRSWFALAAFVVATVVAAVSPASADTLVRDMPKSSVAWRAKVSEAQFFDLVKLKVSELEDMRALWGYLSRYPELHNKVFLGGGAIRGLLAWLEVELQKKSYKRVLATPPPKFRDLIQAGADKDIFLINSITDAHLPAEYRRAAGWDVLENDFLYQSLQAGGSQIEKIGVNPYSVLHSLGLKDFYAGTLTFEHADEAVFEQFRNKHYSNTLIVGNARTALILRHLRFLVLFKGTTVARSHLDNLRKWVAWEYANSYLSRENYWIKKALNKLAKECDNAGIKLAHILNETGLLVPLANLGYKANDQSLDIMLDQMYLDSLTYDFDQIDTYKAHVRTVGGATTVIKRFVGSTKSADEMLRLFSFGARIPSHQYYADVAALWRTHLDRFFSFKPTETQVSNLAWIELYPGELIERVHKARVQKALASNGTDRSLLKELLLTLPRSSRDRVTVANNLVVSAKSPAAILETLALFHENNIPQALVPHDIQRFISYRPSIEELRALRSHCAPLTCLILVSTKLLEKVSTAEDIIDALALPSGSTEKEIRDFALEAWNNNFAKFNLMNPSFEQLITAKDLVSDIEHWRRFAEAAAAKATTVQELLTALTSKYNFNSEESKRLELIRGFKKMFLKMEPSHAEVRTFQQLAQSPGDIELRQSLVTRSRTAEELINAVGFEELKLESDKIKLRQLWIEQLPRLEKFGLSSALILEKYKRVLEQLNLVELFEKDAVKKRTGMAEFFSWKPMANRDLKSVRAYWSVNAPLLLQNDLRFDEMREIYEQTPAFAKQVPFWIFVSNAQSAEQMLELYDWGLQIFGSQLPTYVEYFWNTNQERFAQLKPTAAEVDKVRALLGNRKTARGIHAHLDHLTRAASSHRTCQALF